ncbi:MAG TPA: HDIG domain-containing protein [Chloroflexota bacterium]|nr:HDIG domain-containing protein [Chloroflexota bacterium]
MARLTSAGVDTRAAMGGLPDNTQQLCARIGEAFRRVDPSLELFLVGGVVRDLLLGAAAPRDLDFATSAAPAQTERALSAAGGKVFKIGEKFGTIGGIFSTRSGDVQVEITTYRAEAYEPGSRKPAVAFGQVLADDLARRDFTINAMALDPLSGDVHDPFGGQDDLAAGVIRAVGDAAERFAEDPLRLLRAVRFASRLGFAIDSETTAAIAGTAASLASISRERVRDELEKILVGPAPSRGIRLLCDVGLADYSLPDVPKLRGMEQEAASAQGRHKDVFSHTLQVLDRTPPRLALRWAALLHDIAKPATKRIENGKVTFHGHDHKGERMARRLLGELKVSSELVDRVGRLVGLHLRANAYAGEWTDSAVRRFVLEAGEDLLEDLLQLSRADVTTSRVERRMAIARSVAELERRIRELREEEDIARIASPLDGLELMELFGQGPGRWIQPLKDQLREMVIEGELRQDDKAAAAIVAQRLYRRSLETTA